MGEGRIFPPSLVSLSLRKTVGGRRALALEMAYCCWNLYGRAHRFIGFVIRKNRVFFFLSLAPRRVLLNVLCVHESLFGRISDPCVLLFEGKNRGGGGYFDGGGALV